MQRLLFSASIAFLILTMTLCAQAQTQAGQSQAGQSQAGQGQGNPAAGGRAGMGGRPGALNVGSVNAALTVIEQQIAAIRKAVEGAEMPGGPGAMGGRPGGTGNPGAAPSGQRGNADFQAAMGQMQKRNEAVQAAAAAIAEQVLVLKGAQAAREFQDEMSKLQSIVTAATEEKAVKTSQLAKDIVDARRKSFQETAAKLGIPQGGRGGPGPMMGGGEPPIKGGFEWIK